MRAAGPPPPLVSQAMLSPNMLCCCFQGCVARPPGFSHTVQCVAATCMQCLATTGIASTASGAAWRTSASPHTAARARARAARPPRSWTARSWSWDRVAPLRYALVMRTACLPHADRQQGSKRGNKRWADDCTNRQAHHHHAHCAMPAFAHAACTVRVLCWHHAPCVAACARACCSRCS